MNNLQTNQEVENKLIKVGITVNWRGSWGSAPAQKAIISDISFCENERDKYGINVNEIWAKDKDRCCFGLSNGKWAYGYQIDLIESNLITSDY